MGCSPAPGNRFPPELEWPPRREASGVARCRELSALSTCLLNAFVCWQKRGRLTHKPIRKQVVLVLRVQSEGFLLAAIWGLGRSGTWNRELLLHLSTSS